MIHRFSLNGYNIVVDVNSGAVHILDDVAFGLLEFISPPMEQQCPESAIKALFGKFEREVLLEAYGELLGLYEDGLLFSPDCYEQLAKDVGKPSPVKAMCLHVAHDCNLRCAYCFAGTGSFGGKRGIMPVDVGRAAVDFLIEHSGSRRNLEIDFFGGEPLLNMELVRDVVDYARSKESKTGKNFRFTMTTNGVLLDDETADFINSEMYNVVLSLDGTRETNDRMRKRVDGTGSYDAILPRFKKLVQRRKDGQYFVRGTFTRHNLDFSKDVLHMADQGFDRLSVEPVSGSADRPYSLRMQDLPAIKREYQNLALTMIERKQEGKPFTFFHYEVDLSQGPCVIKRLKGCGAGNEYLAVTPDGELFPCHQFVGKDEYLMGSVLTGEFNEDIKNRFAQINVYKKPKCRGCWAKFYCSGGCHASNLAVSRTLIEPDEMACELERARLECAIMMKAAQTDCK